MGFVLEGFFCLHDVLFSTLMADYDHFLYASTAYNWLPWSIMSVAPGKSKFWTPVPQVGTWKVPVNLGYFSYFLLLFFCPKITQCPNFLQSVCSPLRCGWFATFGSSLWLFVYELQQFLWGDQCICAKTTRKLWLFLLFRYLPELTGPKLTFSRCNRHDWPGEPIKSTHTLEIVLQISPQS